MEVSDPATIYYDNLNNIQLAKNPVFHARTKHIEVHYRFVRERVLSGEVELVYVLTDRQSADIFTKPLGLDKLRQFSSAPGLQHLDVPKLRGRKDRKNHEREQERSRSVHDVESDEEFDFGSAEEAEGSSRRKEPKSSDYRGDEANKDEKAKIKDELETANSDKSRDESETVDLVQMFDSETSNQLKSKRMKGQQKRRQHRDSKGVGKGRTSRQAHRKGRGARNRTGRGARARREARRNRSDDPEEPKEPQVELEGEC